MKHHIIYSSLLLANFIHGNAFAADPQVPDAGILLQQLKQLPELPDLSEPTTKDTVIPDTDKSDQSFKIDTIKFVGNTVFTEQELKPLVVMFEGKYQSLDSLNLICQKISQYYHRNGYPLVRTVVPAQEVANGEILLEIIEATIGDVKLDNQSRVSDQLIKGALTGLSSNTQISQIAFDETLKNIQNIPAISTQSELKPGIAPKTTDVFLKVNDGKRYNANISADNYGNYFTGRARLSGSLNVYNIAKHGDTLSLSLMKTDEDMQYGSLAYDYLLNASGDKIGVSYAALDYEINKDEVKELELNGRVETFSAFVSSNIIQNRSEQLTTKIAIQRDVLRDRVDAVDLKRFRTIDQLSLNLSGYKQDNYFNRYGVSGLNVSLVLGYNDIKNDELKSVDALTTRANGRFNLVNMNLSRYQQITNKTGLNVIISGQLSDSNLDNAQKMNFSGINGVRAYDAGDVIGDEGLMVNAEVRHSLGSFYGDWQAVAFYDVARVKENHALWEANTDKNTGTIQGAGFGLNWVGHNQWSGKIAAVKTVGNTEFVDDNRIYSFISVSKNF